MQTTEILLLSFEREDIDRFIERSGAAKEPVSESLTAGFLDLGDDMNVLLLGMQLSQESWEYNWPFLYRKTLGAVILGRVPALESTSAFASFVDFFAQQIPLPFVIAISMEDLPNRNIPPRAYSGGLAISPRARLSFYLPESRKSVRQLLVDLINTHMETTAARVA